MTEREFIVLLLCLLGGVLLFGSQWWFSGELDKSHLRWGLERPNSGPYVLLSGSDTGIAQLRHGHGEVWVRINRNNGRRPSTEDLDLTREKLGIVRWKFSHSCRSHWESHAMVYWYRVLEFKPVGSSKPPTDSGKTNKGTLVSDVCKTCRDTHTMAFRGGWAPCTACPVPCEDCRAGGNGPYCEHTPCACSCHVKAAGGDRV